MPFKSSDAYRAALSNAKYFDRPYVVFTDTNGNWRSEQLNRPEHVAFAVVWPDGDIERSTVETTAGELERRRAKMTFEVRGFADIGTAFLEESDLPLLLREDAPYHLANTDGREGSFFWVSEDPDCREDQIEQCRSFGFSERFCDVIAELGKQGIAYVRFDADGSEVTELEECEHR